MKTIPARITAEWLESIGACDKHIEIFANEWPDGCDKSSANLLRASAIGLDLGWFAEHVLPAPARKAYEEATAPARKAYEEAEAPARKAYEEAKATSLIQALNLPE